MIYMNSGHNQSREKGKKKPLMPLCDTQVTRNTWCLAQFPHHVTALKSMLEVHFPA